MAAYSRVFLEADSKGRLQIAVENEGGVGHGYRIAGPKYVNDYVSGDFAATTIRHDLDDRDVDEIRAYLRQWDTIHCADQPGELRQLTEALDRYRQQVRTMARHGHLPHQQERMAAAHGELLNAASAVVTLLVEAGAS